MRSMKQDIPFLCFLFFFAISLFNLAGYFFAGILFFSLLKNIKRIRIGFPEVFLITFSVTYFLFHAIHYSFQLENVIIFLCGPWGAYLVGKTYVLRAGRKSALFEIVLVISIGMFLHGLLNWLTYLRSDYYSLYSYYRQSVDVWRRTLVNVNATGLYFSLMMGLSIGVFLFEEHRRIRFLALLFLGISLGITIFFASRTFVVIVALVLGTQGIAWFFSSKVRSAAKKVRLIGLVLVISVTILLVLLYSEEFGAWFNNLKIVERFIKDRNKGRIQVWYYFFNDWNWLRHLFGGGGMLENSPFNYMHNLWLDIYNRVGIIPFITWVAFTVWTAKRIFYFGKIMKKAERYKEYKIFLCIIFATALNAFVEPVLEANPYFFLETLMILGAAEGELRNIEKSPKTYAK